jgi:hypothetical protein
VTASAPVHDAAGPGLPTGPARRPTPWRRVNRRLIPLLATIGLIIIGISSTISWAPRMVGRTEWALPNDLWGTLIAASRLLHGDLAGLYTHPTGLIALPGAAIILMPVVALIDALGLSLQVQNAHNQDPLAWLLAGPYETAISGIALFAADAIAERTGAAKDKRAFLAAAGATALWNVAVRWGHPEDAVAVGLLLYAVLAQSNGKLTRSAWLAGAAIAVQPLVVLAVPVMIAVLPPRRIAGFLVRAAALPAVLLAAAAAANWNATFAAVVEQPNWPTINHRTLWLPLATHLSNGAVAAGPVRLIAVAAACACAIAAARQCRSARPARQTQLAQIDQQPGPAQPWDARTLLTLLWWIAVTLALRSVFEPVMVAFYLWPVLAIALVTASLTWPRLVATTAVVVTVTFASQVSWRSPWTWWLPMLAGLALALLVARVTAAASPPLAAGHPGSR